MPYTRRWTRLSSQERLLAVNETIAAIERWSTQMNEAIASVFTGEACDIELQKLRDWRKRSPENERIYRESECLWRLSSLQILNRRDSAPPPVHRIISEAESRRTPLTPPTRLSVPPRVWRWLTAAAVVAASLVGYTLLT